MWWARQDIPGSSRQPVRDRRPKAARGAVSPEEISLRDGQGQLQSATVPRGESANQQTAECESRQERDGIHDVMLMAMPLL